jgi:signal peptidase II
VRLGYVVDYADLHFGGWRPFLVFNLGDAAITIGVLVLLGRALLVRDKPKASRASVENINA